MNYSRRHIIFLILLGMICCHATAQLLSVDINGGVGRSDTTAPGFSRWDVTGVYLAGSANRVTVRCYTNYTYLLDADITAAATEIFSCRRVRPFQPNAFTAPFRSNKGLSEL